MDTAGLHTFGLGLVFMPCGKEFEVGPSRWQCLHAQSQAK